MAAVVHHTFHAAAETDAVWDAICFLFITPLASLSGWLCVQGAMDLYYSNGMEAVGLIVLTLILFSIYLFWTVVSSLLFSAEQNESAMTFYTCGVSGWCVIRNYSDIENKKHTISLWHPGWYTEN